MNATLNAFNFEGNHSVRTTLLGDKPVFIAGDVARALGCVWNGTMTIKHVPQLWRGVLPDNTLSANQRQLYLTEEGVYFFVCRSDKPLAKRFQEWLASEVLPSIRKTGAYAVNRAQAFQAAPVQQLQQALPAATIDVSGLTAVQRLTVNALVEMLAQKAGV